MCLPVAAVVIAGGVADWVGQISLVNPEEEWTIHNAWFVKQSNFHVRLRSKTKT